MSNRFAINKIVRIFTRKSSTKTITKANLDSSVECSIRNEVYKAKRHPGIFKPRTIELPNALIQAMTTVLADYPVKALLDESRILGRYLQTRQLPPSESFIKSKREEVFNSVTSEMDWENMGEEERSVALKNAQQKMDFMLRSKVYAWQPIEYDEYKSLQYMLSRAAPEYAVLFRVLMEIKVRDEKFRPNSFFDFGSGIGLATWVVKHYWEKSICEYFNVDTSPSMNELAAILLKGGTGNKDSLIKGVFYRQYLPAKNVNYSLVLSAHTLFELPSSRRRLETILSLWNKTEHYLVLIEQGSRAGFKLINEARDFILNLEKVSGNAHVFSPCPHDSPCPRLFTDDTPCNFEVGYLTPPVGQKSIWKTERFSYVVLKKGPTPAESERWQRIVRPVLVRSRHAVCRMCTNRGRLEEVIFSPGKHGKETHHCARSSSWGDLLPVDLEEETQ